MRQYFPPHFPHTPLALRGTRRGGPVRINFSARSCHCGRLRGLQGGDVRPAKQSNTGGRRKEPLTLVGPATVTADFAFLNAGKTNVNQVAKDSLGLRL